MLQDSRSQCQASISIAGSPNLSPTGRGGGGGGGGGGEQLEGWWIYCSSQSDPYIKQFYMYAVSYTICYLLFIFVFIIIVAHSKFVCFGLLSRLA